MFTPGKISFYPTFKSLVQLPSIETRKGRVAEIIVVGNELLNGTSLDTNSNWLSKQMTRLGAIITRKITVPDNTKEISGAFKLALMRKPAWIFSLGGLGPTFDDKTVEGLSLALRRKLKRNRLAVRMLKQSYRRRPEDLGVSKRKLPESSLKMACMPEGARPLQNTVGSAPGVIYTHGLSKIVVLPGVPKEMKTIFSEQVEPLIRKSMPLFKEMERWMRVTGVGEPKIAPVLSRIMKNYSPEVYIKSHALGFRKGESVLKIQLIASAPIDRSSIASEKLTQATKEIRNVVMRLGAKLGR